MSKLNNLSYGTPRFANKSVILSLLALVALVSVVPLVSLNSQAAAVTLKLDPVRGILGSTVTATGKGYSPGARVTIKFGSMTVATTKSNATGGIDTKFTVPQVKAGAYIVVASDGILSTAHSMFTVGSRSHISIKPTTGVQGAVVTIAGKNFASNSALTISFNNKKVGTGTSSSAGTISVKFTVPNDTAGSYAVTVTDALGYSASAAFTIS